MYLLCDGLAYVLAVVLVNLEHVEEDGGKLGDIHGPQGPAHPGVGLEDLRDLAALHVDVIGGQREREKRKVNAAVHIKVRI